MAYFNNKVTKAAFVLLVVELGQLPREALKMQDNYLSNHQRVEVILAYIEQQIAHVTLAEVAAKFHFHPNYLSNFLKENKQNVYGNCLSLPNPIGEKLLEANRFIDSNDC